MLILPQTQVPCVLFQQATGHGEVPHSSAASTSLTTHPFPPMEVSQTIHSPDDESMYKSLDKV